MGKKWIECGVELPNKKLYCLVWDNYLTRIITAVYNPKHRCWDDSSGDDYFTDEIGGRITHWMELPKQPDNV